MSSSRRAIPQSRRLEQLPTYPLSRVRDRVAELRLAGHDPIDFGIGDPKEPTPEFIRRATQAGIDKHQSSGYPPFQGTLEFREAVAAWYLRRFGVSLDPQTEICATVGSKEAIFHIHEAILNPGDEAWGPSPGYPAYRLGTHFAEGIYRPYAIEASHDFAPDFDWLESQDFSRARLLWINTPHAPSGKVASLRDLEDLFEFARRRGLCVFSDEAYADIYFGIEKPPSLLQVSKDGVLCFHTLSKRSAMTGYRIGFVVGDARLIDQFVRLKSKLDTGVTRLTQEGAIAALSDESHVEQMRTQYRKRAVRLCDGFEKIGLPRCFPEAAMYVWQRVPDGMTSETFAQHLLEPEMAIVSTPGAWLSDPVEGRLPGEGFVRLAVVPPMDQVEEAIRRLLRAHSA